MIHHSRSDIFYGVPAKENGKNRDHESQQNNDIRPIKGQLPHFRSDLGVDDNDTEKHSSKNRAEANKCQDYETKLDHHHKSNRHGMLQWMDAKTLDDPTGKRSRPRAETTITARHSLPLIRSDDTFSTP